METFAAVMELSHNKLNITGTKIQSLLGIFPTESHLPRLCVEQSGSRYVKAKFIARMKVN